MTPCGPMGCIDRDDPRDEECPFRTEGGKCRPLTDEGVNTVCATWPAACNLYRILIERGGEA